MSTPTYDLKPDTAAGELLLPPGFVLTPAAHGGVGEPPSVGAVSRVVFHAGTTVTGLTTEGPATVTHTEPDRVNGVPVPRRPRETVLPVRLTLPKTP